MTDFLCRYFSGELTEKERESLFASVSRNPSLKEEFIESYNLMGIVGLLPQKNDWENTRKNLERFMECIRKKGL